MHSVTIGKKRFVPLCYGYAMTMRRAQGSTLDLVGLWFDHCHPADRGYAYVGASRVRTAAGLYLVGKIRRTDWLPVGGCADSEQLRRGYESATTDEDSSAASEDQGASESSSEDPGESESDDGDDASEGRASSVGQDDSANSGTEDVDFEQLAELELPARKKVRLVEPKSPGYSEGAKQVAAEWRRREGIAGPFSKDDLFGA